MIRGFVNNQDIEKYLEKHRGNQKRIKLNKNSIDFFFDRIAQFLLYLSQSLKQLIRSNLLIQSGLFGLRNPYLFIIKDFLLIHLKKGVGKKF